MAQKIGNQRTEVDVRPKHQDDLTYHFYLIVIFTPLTYLKDLNGNRFFLVNSPPGFRNSTSLLRYGLVFHNTRKDVRGRHDPVATANPSKND